MAGRAEETLEFDEEGQWRTAGDRIQVLLDASAAGGAVARERAEQLVREIVDLYGAGLDRLIRMAVEVDPALADRFASDDLVASLLLVHGLHPHDVHRRTACGPIWAPTAATSRCSRWPTVQRAVSCDCSSRAAARAVRRHR